MSTSLHDTDHFLAYPEPPASPLWHRKPRPLTDAQKKRNCELLVRGLRKPRATTRQKGGRSCSPS
ncbi:hypothetical protein [Streptomyces sp. NBC_00872]|uniref:hypothetical protein n=1 Tax=Streptomyces sp. NBC_00872 TaxID=2903686 RepID=UPI00386AE791|nr:hypothetical protein OG214_37955 [Streptomyces sp. NBC_00872]